jgi:uncharacterized protein (TIGR00297 family)
VDGPWLLVAVLALAGLSILAYALRALDMLGAVASFFLGFEIVLLGGLRWLALMTFFPVLGVLATRLGQRTKELRRVAEASGGERGVANVLGNGLAAGLAALALLLEPAVPKMAATLAFATALAAATADTLASELGVLAKRARSMWPPFAAAPVGSNGAVSWRGQTAAVLGSSILAMGSVYLLSVPWSLAWVPALAGFAGCQLDSLLGATLERDATRQGPLSKQDVNFLAAAVPAGIVLAVGAMLL